jgi:chloramphenicol-sensitive protein RarD
VNTNNALSGRGVFFAALAYFLWGILPLYWKLLAVIQPFHILAFRILFSLLLVGCLLLIQKKITWLALFGDRKKGLLLLLTAFTISFNWGLFIWAVNNGHTVESSLGYYINPLVSIVLGLCFLGEKLLPLQWAAFALAAAGVLILTVFSGTLPLISLGLALSFGFYGLLKKNAPLSALESLGAETLAAAPLGLLLLFINFNGEPHIDRQAVFYVAELPPHSWILLACCGAVTAFPLYCFAKGARLLPLSTIGFIQFIAPTLQFVVGVFIFGEYFPPENYFAFGCIWLAALLYIVSLKLAAHAGKGV